MNKNDLLKNIAEKAYDVGFGAKKHFATYDIIEKAPGLIGFFSMAIGTLALVIDGLSTELTSAALIILGIVGLYISFYDHKKVDYDSAGKELTKLFNELKTLYFTVKNIDESANTEPYQKTLSEIENKYYSASISKQILFSNWYAHYKFFWEHQIEWVNEQLNFNLLKDKIPLSLSLFLLPAIIFISIVFSDVINLICAK